MVGTTISHYKILEKLGEGGMGVVYKAHDNKLDRDVALKFLPRGLEAHEQERSRFLQEAKAASALNHPHICGIHSLGEYEGQEFIDMEYVEGRTLREAIHAKVPDVNVAINYALQIGEALEEAHSKGIVHRDVKPENILVNEKNQIKVMDFGLAKLKGSLKLTRTSSTVGTLAYMAPEQLRGGEVDARSDIFSFGIVLYEMLSGHPPFRGEHEAALMYSILNEEPTPIERYRQDVPAELQHILGRAIEKDPEERYQSVHDMLIDLRRLTKVSARVMRPSKEATATSEQKRSFVSRNRLLLGAALVLVLVAGIYFLFVEHGPAINLEFNQRTLDIPMSAGIDATISPDGKWIVFTAANKNEKMDLYVVSSSGETPRRITDDSTTEGYYGSQPRVSPDGRSIVYSRYRDKFKPELCTVPLVGGQVRKIADGMCPQWSRSGNRIGYLKYPICSESKQAEFWTIDPDGKENRREFVDTAGLVTMSTGAKNEFYHFDWSPDGKSIVWLRRLRSTRPEIAVRSLIDGSERVIVWDTTGFFQSVCWASKDVIFYTGGFESGGHIWAVSPAGGARRQVTRGTGSEIGVSTSSDGSKIIANHYADRSWLWIGRFDGSPPVKVSEFSVFITQASLSPDGKQIAFCKNIEGTGYWNLAVINRDGSNERALTNDKRGMYLAPVWSPDGKWISFVTRPPGTPFESSRTYILDPQSPGQPRLVFDGWEVGTWIDTSTLSVVGNGIACYWAYIDGRPPRRLANDSLNPFFVDGGRYVLYEDFRINAPNSDVPRVVSREDWDMNGGKNPRFMKRPLRFNPTGKMRFYLDPRPSDQLWRIWLPDGREERIPGSYEMPSGMDVWSLRWDESEFVYRTESRMGSIMIFENLLR